MNNRVAIIALILSVVGFVQFQKEAPGHGASTSHGSAKYKANRSSCEPAGVATRNPVAASLAATLSCLEEMPIDEARDGATQEAADKIEQGAIPEVLKLLTGDHRIAAGTLRQELVLRWATNAPADAAAWAVSQHENQAELLPIIAATWADMDLESATQWVDSLPAGEAKTGATIGLGYEAAHTQPAMAFNLANQLEPGEQRDALLLFSASQWASAEPEEALKWAQNLPQGEVSDRLISTIAINAAKQTPEASANLVASAVNNNSDMERAAVAIIQRWAQTEPAAAAAWIEQFPDAPIRQQATDNLMSIWVAQDDLAAWKWVNQLPPDQKNRGVTSYDKAVAQFSRPE